MKSGYSKLTDSITPGMSITINENASIPKSFAQNPQTEGYDLIMSHVSYTITDIPDIEDTHVPNLYNDIVYGTKLLTGRQKMKAKPVLSDLNVIFPAGTSTLVVGTPGCGSTSLLNALYGNLNNKYLSGKITYGGKQITDYKNWKSVASYCSQYDYHNALLTVKETLEFARQCQCGFDTKIDLVYIYIYI